MIDFILVFCCGVLTFIALQGAVLPCNHSCRASYARTAVKDAQAGGTWSLDMWEDIAKQMKEEDDA